ncbi:transmembrane protein 238-like [Hippocampus zosterae]|uniref:transmembrane protein 238-like n=1 Tax=Hippocampus zosterae TaxID=109293 RepID=UPI00223C8FBD|nr:transmembrane protein 238-like [Hippocampus zosterae]
MGMRCLVGKCFPLLLAGLALDVAGLTLLLVGVFADVRAADGQFYGDFFIFTGALVIFVSLAFWVMWYAGNVRVTPGDPRDARAEGLAARLVRKLSERLSRKMATAIPTAAGDARAHDNGVAGRLSPHRAGRVTWGKATVHNNNETEPRNDNNFQGSRQENYSQDENYNKGYDNEGYDNEGYDREIYDSKENYDKGYDSDADNYEKYNKEKNDNYKEEGYDRERYVTDEDGKDEAEQL